MWHFNFRSNGNIFCSQILTYPTCVDMHTQGILISIQFRLNIRKSQALKKDDKDYKQKVYA